MRNYLVEINSISRYWIEAESEEDAKEMAESYVDNDQTDIEGIYVIDSIDIDADDSYYEFLKEEEQEYEDDQI